MARSSSELGRSAGLTDSRVVGQHRSAGGDADPVAARRAVAHAARSASVARGTCASSLRSESTCKAGGFSAKKTSAGEREPSWMIWFASVASSAERTLTCDARALLEVGDELRHRLLVLAAVERDRAGAGPGRTGLSGASRAGSGGDDECGDRQGAERASRGSQEAVSRCKRRARGL